MTITLRQYLQTMDPETRVSILLDGQIVVDPQPILDLPWLDMIRLDFFQLDFGSISVDGDCLTVRLSSEVRRPR